jgi:hypothetical protein
MVPREAIVDVFYAELFVLEIKISSSVFTHRKTDLME